MSDLDLNIGAYPSALEVFRFSKFDGDKAYKVELNFLNCQADWPIIEQLDCDRVSRFHVAEVVVVFKEERYTGDGFSNDSLIGRDRTSRLYHVLMGAEG